MFFLQKHIAIDLFSFIYANQNGHNLSKKLML
jgi:hypothetical protein